MFVVLFRYLFDFVFVSLKFDVHVLYEEYLQSVLHADKVILVETSYLMHILGGFSPKVPLDCVPESCTIIYKNLYFNLVFDKNKDR